MASTDFAQRDGMMPAPQLASEVSRRAQQLAIGPDERIPANV
jgi:hypothetical protein